MRKWRKEQSDLRLPMRIGIFGQEAFVHSIQHVINAIRTKHALLISEVLVFVWPDDAECRDQAMDDVVDMAASLDTVFLSAPSVYLYPLASRIVRNGVHVFLDWRSGSSIKEYEELARLAEEAQVDVGLSRPLRSHPFFDALPAARPASTFLVQRDLCGRSAIRFQHALEEAVDLCCYYAHNVDVRRLDAQVVRDGRVQPHTLLASLRFQNGTYVHIQLREGVPVPRHSLQAAGPGFREDVELAESLAQRPPSGKGEFPGNKASITRLSTRVDLQTLEIQAFLDAIHNGAPAPSSIISGLQTRRLIEKLRKSLR